MEHVDLKAAEKRVNAKIDVNHAIEEYRLNLRITVDGNTGVPILRDLNDVQNEALDDFKKKLYDRIDAGLISNIRMDKKMINNAVTGYSLNKNRQNVGLSTAALSEKGGKTGYIGK